MKQKDQKAKVTNWHQIDAKNQVLGRIATQAAKILMGKNKPSYSSHMDMGDNVVIVNAEKVILSGKKETQKKYYHYSGYPGGLKERTAKQIRENKPEFLIKHAVTGMLPKTKMGRQMIKKLFIYKGSNHPYKDKIES